MRDNLRYNLGSQTKLLRSFTDIRQYGLNLLRVGSKLWSMAPTEIKNSATLNTFKEKRRK